MLYECASERIDDSSSNGSLSSFSTKDFLMLKKFLAKDKRPSRRQQVASESTGRHLTAQASSLCGSVVVAG